MGIESGKVYFSWDSEKGNKIGIERQTVPDPEKPGQTKVVCGKTVKTGLPVLIKKLPSKPIKDLVIYEMRADEFKKGWPEVKIKKGYVHELASNKHW